MKRPKGAIVFPRRRHTYGVTRRAVVAKQIKSGLRKHTLIAHTPFSEATVLRDARAQEFIPTPKPTLVFNFSCRNRATRSEDRETRQEVYPYELRKLSIFLLLVVLPTTADRDLRYVLKSRSAFSLTLTYCLLELHLTQHKKRTFRMCSSALVVLLAVLVLYKGRGNSTRACCWRATGWMPCSSIGALDLARSIPWASHTVV